MYKKPWGYEKRYVDDYGNVKRFRKCFATKKQLDMYLLTINRKKNKKVERDRNKQRNL